MTRFRLLTVFFLISSCLAGGTLADTALPWAESPTNRLQFRFTPFGEARYNNEGRISGWWSIEEEQAPIDDSPTVYAINWSAYDARSSPLTTLGVSCENQIISIIFFQDDILVNDRSSFEITHRIDSAHAQSTLWDGLTDPRGAGLFGSTAKDFLRDLQYAKKLFIRVTEKNGQRHDAVFDLAGIQEVAGTVIRACSLVDVAEDDYFRIKSSMMHIAFPYLSQDDYREIQNLLNAGGFKAGTPDGIWSRQSINAMRAFQEQNGLTATGAIDRETLKAMGFQPSGEINNIRAFQKHNGLPVTGRIDHETLKAMGLQPGGE